MYQITPDEAQDQKINLPSSKSITHRMLILAALNRGTTKISNALMAEDTEITKIALQTMGAIIDSGDNSFSISRPIGQTTDTEIYLGNSGSSARFLLPLGTFLDKTVRFYGTDRLHKRPFAELLNAVGHFGHQFDATDNSLPVFTHPGISNGGLIEFDVLPSSQIVTALMMAALKMKRNLTVRMTSGMPSMPYIKMTAELMKRLRLNVEYTTAQIRVDSVQPDLDWTLNVEKDFSAASYWVLYALINNSKVTLKNMTIPSLQGDEIILNIAESVGADIMLFTDRIEINGRINRPFDFNCENTPDLVPALGVLSLFCPSNCRMRNVKFLEHKESNRIQALQDNIDRIGGKSQYEDGQLTVIPQKSYEGNVIDTFNDHRIAMSFAMAGTRIGGIIIDNPDCVNKSYPGFWNDFTHWKNTQNEKG
jgi:3-phosphoshikimate 1-carboxyvinyltransferase